MSGMRDIDFEMLKIVLQHCSKEIYDATTKSSGYTIAKNEHYDGDTSSLIDCMKRATELMQAMYDKCCSLTELGNDAQQEISKQKNKGSFLYNGKEVTWNDLPLEIRKEDYPYYFDENGNDCYPVYQG